MISMLKLFKKKNKPKILIDASSIVRTIRLCGVVLADTGCAAHGCDTLGVPPGGCTGAMSPTCPGANTCPNVTQGSVCGIAFRPYSKNFSEEVMEYLENIVFSFSDQDIKTKFLLDSVVDVHFCVAVFQDLSNENKAEAINVIFDSRKTTFEKIINIYLETNQNPRIIFYENERKKQIYEECLRQLNCFDKIKLIKPDQLF